MIPRRSTLTLGAAGLASLASSSILFSTPALAAGLDEKNPDAYDWTAIYKQYLKDLSHEGVNISALHTAGHARLTTTYGVKTKAAKEAAKVAISALKHIGKKAWDKTVEKAPLPASVKKYLGYETVMKVLNIVLNFEGEVTDGLTKGFEKVGAPHWIAAIAARAIVTFLL